MILYDFIRLNQEERAELVFLKGNFISSNPERGNLYDMGSFYAEVVYDGDRNEIQAVRGFKTIKNLDPYIENLSLKIDAIN